MSDEKHKKQRKRRFLLFGFLGGLVLAGVFAWRPIRLAHTLRQAREAIDQREPLQALEYLHEARRLDPGRAETAFQMARAYRRLGQLDRVRKQLEIAWVAGFDKQQLEREQWLVLGQIGQLEDCEQQLIDRLSAPDEDRVTEVSEALVLGYFSNLRFAEAQPILGAWQKDRPSDPEPHFLRGFLFAALYRWAEAAEQYRNGLTLAPLRTDARLRLARALVELKEHEQAEAEFQKCLEQQPEDLDVMIAWCQFLVARSRADEARPVLKQVLARAPSDPTALGLMGRVAMAADMPDDAVKWLGQAVQKTPRDLELRRAYAEALKAVGKIDDAKTHFEYFAEAELAWRRVDRAMYDILDRPDDVESRYLIGSTLLHFGTEKDGVKWLQSVLRIANRHAPTHELLAEYYTSRGELEAAQRHREAVAKPTD